MAKNTVLELTISGDYVDWGVWESLRELLQNWKDAQDLGSDSRVWAANSSGLLSIKMQNRGVTLEREKLILGCSSKRGDSRQRGQFGEGMKLAWASLIRHGLSVWIQSGDEIWVPEISYSEKFGCDLLKIVSRPCKFYNGIQVEVRGVHPDDWTTVQRRLLWETKPKNAVKTSYGDILMDENHKGLLFSKDIYVGKLPDEYSYGYNIQVELDRDRKMADPFSLKYAIGQAIRDAVQRDLISAEDIMKSLESNPGSGEGQIFSNEINNSQYSGRRAFHKKVAAAFISEHGADAVPVTSIGDSVEAKHHGMKGVMVSAPVKAIIEVDQGTFERRKVKRALDVEKRFSLDELTDDQQANLIRAAELLEGIDESAMPEDVLGAISVVEFVGDNVLGTYTAGAVNVSAKVLCERAELISVLVHEFAHVAGGDGTVEHRDAIDRIFGKMIAANW